MTRSTSIFIGVKKPVGFHNREKETDWTQIEYVKYFVFAQNGFLSRFLIYFLSVEKLN